MASQLDDVSLLPPPTEDKTSMSTFNRRDEPTNPGSTLTQAIKLMHAAAAKHHHALVTEYRALAHATMQDQQRLAAFIVEDAGKIVNDLRSTVADTVIMLHEMPLKTKTTSGRHYRRWSLSLALQLILLAGVAFLVYNVVAVEADAQSGSTTIINTNINTFSYKRSQIRIATKPFILCRTYETQELLKHNELYHKHLDHVLNDVWVAPNDFEKSNYEPYEQLQAAFRRHKDLTRLAIARDQVEFKQSYEDLKAFLTAYGNSNIHSEDPDMEWKEDAIKKGQYMEPDTSNKIEYNNVGKHALEKRSPVAAAVGVILPLLRFVAPKIIGPMLTRTLKSVATFSIEQAPRLLALKNDAYLNLKGVTLASSLKNMSTQTLTDLAKTIPPVTDWLDNPGGNHTQLLREWAKHNNQYKYEANALLFAVATQKMDELTAYFTGQRETLWRQNRNMLDALRQATKGRVTQTLLPLQDLKEILDRIDQEKARKNLNIEHITDTQHPSLFYDLLSPVLLIKNTTILVLLTVPVVPTETKFDLYRIRSIAFASREGIAMALNLKNQHYAVNKRGTSAAEITDADLEECQEFHGREGLEHICPMNHPVTDVLPCQTAIHYQKDSMESTDTACPFKKVDGTVAQFLYVADNTFLFFLPKPSKLHITCTKGTKDVLHLKQSGKFQFPPHCSGRIQTDQGSFLFHDTSVELIQTNASKTDPDHFMSFLNATPPAYRYAREFEQLRQQVLQLVLSNNATTSNVQELIAEANARIQERQIRSIEHENQHSHSYETHLFTFLITVSSSVAISIIGVFSMYIRRRCPSTRPFHRPAWWKNCGNGQDDEDPESSQNPIQQQSSPDYEEVSRDPAGARRGIYRIYEPMRRQRSMQLQPMMKVHPAHMINPV